ncbi:chemokine (C-C motif) ligand 44 isoform 2-T2 [Clarias gariepinus]|uniref:chemokine (C-C motif) ligand 44 isoform X2 n=1 Tax=Clarias gariepinus TaxID=13013 RepID=UPI00234DD611|nr:chemokine (C-C motif) ligand 44 isoform X2 [Clarias gariepinus]
MISRRLTMLLQTVFMLSATVFLGYLEGNGVQMQRSVQCCMQYSEQNVRTKDVLKFEVQNEGPDCSIKAIILYTKKLVKCADPSDRKVKRLLKKLRQRENANKSTQIPKGSSRSFPLEAFPTNRSSK